MKKLFFLLFLFSANSWSGVSSEIFIQGKIGNEFDDQKVKIIDSLNQTYFLEKKYFPKDFTFKQGESFSIEIPEEALDNIKLIKKK